jgi:hypothetical protein
MGLSFPNPIRAAQNFASGAQRAVTNTVQSAQRNIGNTVNQVKSFAGQQVNNVQKQAQNVQKQAGSFANNAQKSLNSAYQSNVAKPLQKAQSQLSSSINNTQKSLSNSFQSNVAKPLQKTQNQISSSVNNTQKSLSNSFQSNVVKPLQQKQSQINSSLSNTQKSLSNSFQSNVVKPFQATQNKIERSLNNTQKQIGQTTQQLQKNFDQGVQGAQKKIDQKAGAMQKQLNQGLEGKTGYERFSQRMDNVFKVSEKVGDKLAHFNQVGGVPSSSTRNLNVAGEAIKTATDLSKGIGSLINGTPKWFSSAGDLASGKEHFSKKEAAAAVFRSVSNLGYGMVTGAGDLLAKAVAPGGGRDIYSKATKDVHKGLSDSYERDAKKIGIDPNSKTSKTVEQATDVAGAVATIVLPGMKKVPVVTKLEEGAATANRASGTTILKAAEGGPSKATSTSGNLSNQLGPKNAIKEARVKPQQKVQNEFQRSEVQGEGKFQSGGQHLRPRQRAIHEALPNSGDTAIFHKRDVGMSDLKKLSAETGDEYSMFTKGNERFVIRGKPPKTAGKPPEIEVPAHMYQDVVSGRMGKFSGHTHPPGYRTTPSNADKGFLDKFNYGKKIVEIDGKWKLDPNSGLNRSAVWGDVQTGDRFNPKRTTSDWYSKDQASETILRNKDSQKYYGGQ